MTRYALYFTPAAASPWWNAGCRWLGLDPASDGEVAQSHIPGVAPLIFAKLTADARRYGFHATLKAPFRLVEGFSEEHLALMAQAFCKHQRPILLEQMQVRPLGGFLALRPFGPQEEIAALAMRCLSYFDPLRAAPTEVELAKRRRAGLSCRQESLLERWGYPYVEEEFRFHLTLTDRLTDIDSEVAYAIRKAAEDHFAALADMPLPIDGLTICKEAHPGARFSVWRRFSFNAECAHSGLPTLGRIFFCVGPSGAGKDTLLQWVQHQLPDGADVVFARRTITRMPDDSEAHDAVDTALFWRLAAAGHFAMIWQANDLCYGIPRSIEAHLQAGRDVVVNGSREYVPQLLKHFPQAQVIWIDADAHQLRERLQARQRESGAALLKRIERATQFTAPDMQAVIRLQNNGPLEDAGRQLLSILQR